MNFVKPESVQNRYNLTSTSGQFPAPQHSGRVPNMTDPALQEHASRPYALYDTRPPIYDDDRRQLVGHIHHETPLNTVFFSKGNIDKLQSDIQEQVFLMTGRKHRIDRQNDDDIKIIMRSYYLMFSQNNPAKIAEELADLNSRVVGFASAKIYSELDFYLFYRNDIQDFAPPIANPMNVHVHGSRTGELKSFF